MDENKMSGLPDSVTKSLKLSSEQLSGLESLSERMLKIQSDSLKLTQHRIADIVRAQHIPNVAKSMASISAGIQELIPKIDLPISTIAAMQELHKTTLATLQLSMPDLSHIATTIGSSMARFQTISSFLSCCEATTWPLFFIASTEVEEDMAHFMKAFSDDQNLNGVVDEYAIAYLDQNKISDVLNEWLEDELVSSDKKPLLERAVMHHLNKDYFASTCILMCLVEGLIEDCDSEFDALASCDEEGLEYIASHLGLNDGIANRRKKGYAKDQLAAITYGVESGIYYWEASAKYIATVTLSNNPEEKLLSANPLRNKICHGAQVNYGTVIHSLKAILVVDLLIRLSRSFKGKVENE